MKANTYLKFFHFLHARVVAELVDAVPVENDATGQSPLLLGLKLVQRVQNAVADASAQVLALFAFEHLPQKTQILNHSPESRTLLGTDLREELGVAVVHGGDDGAEGHALVHRVLAGVEADHHQVLARRRVGGGPRCAADLAVHLQDYFGGDGATAAAVQTTARHDLAYHWNTHNH